MSHGGERRRRVLVAGTAFGRIYLSAIQAAPESFELAGIFARGSEYSRRCAAAWGVPLYTSIDDVPPDIDIGCVVVRSGATGGTGSNLARALLERGVHVLQEHPVHAAEIADCLSVAKKTDTAYAVNTLYPNLLPVRRFLAAASCLRSRQQLQFVDAACNSQVAYPLLDILGRVVGGLRPWSFRRMEPDRASALAPSEPLQPFQELTATLGHVAVSLRVQNQVHPEDPDNHSFLMHRVTMGCEAGVLSLAETHGPVLWNPRLHAPRDETGRLMMSGPGTERLAAPSTVLLGEACPGTYHDVFARTWPNAVLVALHELCADIEDPARRSRRWQWDTSVSLAWRDLTNCLGMPELIRPPVPAPIGLDELRAAVQAVGAYDLAGERRSFGGPAGGVS